MSNLRDLLGYAFDAIDVFLVRHRWYAYCKFVTSVFSTQETIASRFFERFYH